MLINWTPKQKIHIIQDFNATPYQVFSFFSNHDRLSEIYPAFIKLIAPSSDPTNIYGVGSTRAIFRFPLFFTETVTKYIEPTIIEYKITFGGPVKNHVGTMKFYPMEDGEKTRLDYSIEFEPILPYSGFLINTLNRKFVMEALSLLALRFNQNPNF